jgi:hypothetical protein
MIVRTTVKSIQDIMRQDVGVDGDAQRISQLCWMFFLKIIDDQDQELELTKDDYRSPIPKKHQWRTWAADPEGITGEELLTFVNDELFPALKNLSVSNKVPPGRVRRARVTRKQAARLNRITAMNANDLVVSVRASRPVRRLVRHHRDFGVAVEHARFPTPDGGFINGSTMVVRRERNSPNI